ncbi:DUF3450 domain-containing protein [Marinicellulosiphila megalodicopiae]|uniref:DUF3450 domain-containing protein n=1 Tax=Marinicellulosiphila megalodicopiae TaxID=2724896 RepID=UPI003BB0C146
MNLNYKKILSISCVSICAIGVAHAKVIDKVTENIEMINQNGVVSQQKIEAIQAKTDTLFEQYIKLQDQLEQLSINNQYIQNLIDDQIMKLAKLDSQLNSIDETNSALIPLMQQMISTLKLFVQLDTPFLLEKRMDTVSKLEGVFKQSNLSIAQKYQQILQAYVIESQYGQTIETYQGQLNINGQNLTVQFFRMGRLALYYRSIDQKNAYVWNNKNKTWIELDSSHMFSLDKAMKMAQNKVTPALISLPVVWDSVINSAKPKGAGL